MKKGVFSIITMMVLVIVSLLIRGWIISNVLDSLTVVPRLITYYASWWIILIPIFIFMGRDKEKCRDLGFTKEKVPQQIIIGVILGVVTSLALSGIVTLAGLREFFFGYTEGYIPTLGAFAYGLFEVIILTALVEEIIFRGYLFKKMMDVKNSKWLTITVTSVLFGLIHINIFSGSNILNIIFPAFFGLIYASCRAYSKRCSLLSLIIAHGLHNALNGSVIFGVLDLL
jgi:membrane protease YdiL (CAAX protease family)